MEVIIECRSTGAGASTRPIAFNGGARLVKSWSAGRTHWRERLEIPEGGYALIQDISNRGNHSCYVLGGDGSKTPTCMGEPRCDEERALMGWTTVLPPEGAAKGEILRIARLYIDIDDTIFARYLPDTFLEPRPAIVSQLRTLSRLLYCYWLTCWPWEEKYGMSIQTLLRSLYAHDLIQGIQYMKWGAGHPDRKAGAVLDPVMPQDFWWLEDRLGKEELAALQRAGMEGRYIEVDSLGPWGFADACLELFKRAGITESDVKGTGGHMRLFRKEEFLSPIIASA